MTALPTVPLILDTDVLIDIENELPKALDWFASLSGVPHVCGFAAMELLYGARDKRELRGIERFLQPFPVVWPTEADLHRALVYCRMLRLEQGIGLMDLLIATTAIGAELTLVTRNIKHFRHVPGLSFDIPYQK